MSHGNQPFKSLKEVIHLRRSVREFTGAPVSSEDLRTILDSAMYAPFAAATGIPLKDIRKIFIFSQNTDSMKQAQDILLAQIRRNGKVLKLMLLFMPFLRKKMAGFLSVLDAITRNGIPSLNQASFYIVIAEKKGFPPVGKQSIAHALQNMWLTATDLGLGFHLVSATGFLSKNKEFLKLLRLPRGKYELDGCVIGIPVCCSSDQKDIDSDGQIIWME